MNCEEALVLLSGYLDGSNTEEEMTQLREHLTECPACSRLLEAMEEIADDLYFGSSGIGSPSILVRKLDIAGN